MSENPKCSCCRTYFVPSLKSSGLPYNTCDKCRKRTKECYNSEQRQEYLNKYYNLNAEKRKEYEKNYREANVEKRKEYDKDRYKQNTEKFQKQQKEYYKKNAEKCKEKNKEYRILNAEKYHQYQREYGKEYKKKMKANLPWYLIQLQRGQINRCLKLSLLNKTKHSVEYLGCDIETLINYFIKKMEYFSSIVENDVKMDWSNIHTDHIKPVSRFNLDDEHEFLDCCHYTNLQPLLIQDNLKKKNKWTEDNEKFWREHIRNNDEYCEIYLTVI